MLNKTSNFFFEKRLWKRGFNFVAGIDEVGRGSFAGPLVAAAVVIPPSFKGEPLQGVKIDDSKKLTARQREAADMWIRKNCLVWGIGSVSVSEINQLGVSKATFMAFRRAVNDANTKFQRQFEFEKEVGKIDYLLIDAFYLPYMRGLPAALKQRKNGRVNHYHHKNTRQLAIKKGDEKSFSIAASSIVAKVYRDKAMTVLSKNPRYKKYGWDRNKGYGTLAHRETIQSSGVTCHHRKVFVRNLLG